MTRFDKVMHMIGLAAAGVLVGSLTGGIASFPVWAKIVCLGVAYGTGTVTQPIVGNKPTQ